MAHVIPCVRGKMGNTEYYEATMPARELVSAVRPAKEVDGWASRSVEERLQRELNEARIREEIVPYLAQATDRFFGSLIVLIYKGSVEFEPMGSIGYRVPAAYRSVAERIGFLTIEGGELIVLDGQHRLVALREIIEGKPETQGEFTQEVPNDDICLIFIKHESNEKTRRVFNKVNRYARPTNRGDNFITSEDDGYAIVARRLLEKGAPLDIKDNTGKLMVNWRNNTLAASSLQLTTLSAIYEILKDALACEGIANFDEKSRVNRPTDKEIDRAYEVAERWWRAVLSGLEPYRAAIADPSSIPEMRKNDAPSSLLFKPAGQIALFKGLRRALEKKGLRLEDVVNRANKVDWKISSEMWQNIIVRPNKTMIARKEAYELAAELIAYLIAADKMEPQEVKNLRRSYNKAKGYNFDDPSPEEAPRDLPAPVVKAT
ncbi:hypothetical protein NKDENANG_03988 [Candidatus Entotheonellaceae bacterium PAL068K]